ncbi:unnamed protein product [Rhizophagus irregularis]|nr:unnamed protein product [Rhizophagus irregularis]
MHAFVVAENSVPFKSIRKSSLRPLFFTSFFRYVGWECGFAWVWVLVGSVRYGVGLGVGWFGCELGVWVGSVGLRGFGYGLGVWVFGLGVWVWVGLVCGLGVLVGFAWCGCLGWVGSVGLGGFGSNCDALFRPFKNVRKSSLRPLFFTSLGMVWVWVWVGLGVGLGVSWECGLGVWVGSVGLRGLGLGMGWECGFGWVWCVGWECGFGWVWVWVGYDVGLGVVVSVGLGVTV